MILSAIEIDLELGPFDVLALPERDGTVGSYTVSLLRCNCWGHSARRNGPFEMLFCDEHRALENHINRSLKLAES